MREPKPANPVPMRSIKTLFEMPVVYERYSVKDEKEDQRDEVDILTEQLEKAGYPKHEISAIIKSMGLKRQKGE